jgi:hypothetical protein
MSVAVAGRNWLSADLYRNVWASRDVLAMVNDTGV